MSFQLFSPTGLTHGRLAAFAALSLALLTPPAYATTTIVSSVLPTGRSVETNQSATLFATIINAGAEDATNCRIERDAAVPVDFEYRTTDPLTNEPNGVANAPVTIPAGAAQSFLMALSSSTTQDVVEFEPRFLCDNAPLVTPIIGLNTFTFSVSETPVPDIVALSATVSADGIIELPQRESANAFTVATVNLGAGGGIRVSAQQSNTDLPASISLCETDPATSICITPSTPVSGELALSMPAGSTKTFGLFVSGTDDVPFDPANNRVFVRFSDADGATRGSTSVALRTRSRSETEPLQLVESIAIEAIAQPLTSMQVLLGLERELLRGASSLAESGTMTTTSSCIQGGSIEWQLDDRNTDGALSTGDVMTGVLTDCRLPFGTANEGQIELLISQLVARSDTSWSLGGEARILSTLVNRESQDLLSITGGFVFNHVRTTNGNGSSDISSSFASLDGLPLRAVLFQEEFSLRDWTWNRTSDADLITDSFAGDLSSPTLGGQLSCTLIDVVAPFFANLPDTGELLCTGLNGAQIKLTGRDTSTSDFADIRIDKTGSGVFSVIQENSIWAGFNGRVFSTPPGVTLRQPQFLPLEPIASINVAVNEIVLNPSRAELYVANPVGVLVLNPATLDVITTIMLPDTVGSLAVSPDGANLYVGYENRGEIERINLDLRSPVATVDLGENRFSEELFAADIEVDPIDPTRVAVSLFDASSDHGGVALIQNDVRLDLQSDDRDRSDRITFNSEGRLFGYNNSTTEFGLRELRVDGSGITQQGDVLTDFFSDFGNDIFAAGSLLVSAGRTPTIVNFDEKKITGQFISPDFAFNRGISIDTAANRLWVIGSDVLTYDLQTNTLLGRNRSMLPDDVLGTAATTDTIIVAESNRLSVFNKNDIRENQVSDCTPELIDGISHYPCAMADAVYNPDTAQFLTTLPSSAGAIGNSVAFINASTGNIDRTVSVGSEPGKLVLNDDRSSAFIALQSSNVVAELSLGTDTVSSSDALLNESFRTEPVFATLLATSPTNNRNLIVDTTGPFGSSDIRLISDGVVTAPEISSSIRGLRDIDYAPNDATTIYATSFSEFFILNLDATGATGFTRLENLFSQRFVRLGEQLLSERGQLLDPRTLIARQPFGEIDATVVSFQSDQNRVLFGFRDGTIQVFDRSTSQLIATVTIPGANGRSLSTLATSPEGALLLTEDGDAWLIPNSLLDGT